LGQIIVALAGQEGVAVSAHDALDVAVAGQWWLMQRIYEEICAPIVDIVEHALHDGELFGREWLSGGGGSER